MILTILVAVIAVAVLLSVITSSLKTTAEGVNGLTGLVQRLNRWLDAKRAGAGKSQAERQAWFDAQIAAKKAERKK